MSGLLNYKKQNLKMFENRSQKALDDGFNKYGDDENIYDNPFIQSKEESKLEIGSFRKL
jgi:hypothetical protein